MDRETINACLAAALAEITAENTPGAVTETEQEGKP